MKLLKFEAPNSKEAKKEIIEHIKKSDSFLIIFAENKGDEVWHQWVNMTNADVIVACETVKAKVLQGVME